MRTRTVDLGGLGVAVTADDTVLTILDHYVGHLPAAPATDAVLELVLDIAPLLVEAWCRVWGDCTPDAVRHSHPDLAYRQWDDTSRRILLPAHGPLHAVTITDRRLRVVAATVDVLAVVAVRVLRQVIMRWSEHIGGGSAHAGAVVLGGQAVLVGGQAGAGKTATVTTLVERHGAEPIANDRVALLPSRDDERWTAVGVPLAWRITPKGVQASPRLRAAVAAGHLHRGITPVDQKIEFTPAEIATYLGKPMASIAPTGRLVVLVRDTPHLSQSGSTADLLAEHLGFAGRDQFAEDWLDLRPLLARTTGPTKPPDSSMWARLARSVPITAIRRQAPGELAGIAASIAERVSR